MSGRWECRACDRVSWLERQEFVARCTNRPGCWHTAAAEAREAAKARERRRLDVPPWFWLGRDGDAP
jgi:hypothetical protein